MSAIHSALRSVVAANLEQVPAEDLLSILAKLSSREKSAPAPSTIVVKSPRFAVRDDLVYDSLLDLTWTRGFVPGGKRSYEESVKAACAFEYRGQGNFRAPTVSERLSISDFGHFNPAIDTSIFECPDSGWEWTGSVYKPSPEGYAWGVFFGYGDSGANYRDGNGFVRAVRPGQFLVTLD